MVTHRSWINLGVSVEGGADACDFLPLVGLWLQIGVP